MRPAPAHAAGAGGGTPQDVQRIASRLEEHRAGGRQLDAAAGAREQHDAQLVFDFLDLVADGRGRQADLVRGAREVQVAAGGLKGSQRSGAGQHAVHDLQAKFNNQLKTTGFSEEKQSWIVVKLDNPGDGPSPSGVQQCQSARHLSWFNAAVRRPAPTIWGRLPLRAMRTLRRCRCGPAASAAWTCIWPG
ncbi:hypothetical protein D3C71_1652380 [compost metagenome]